MALEVGGKDVYSPDGKKLSREKALLAAWVNIDEMQGLPPLEILHLSQADFATEYFQGTGSASIALAYIEAVFKTETRSFRG